MALARNPRSATNINLSVGLLMLLLIASLLLYRFGAKAASTLNADIAAPPQLWRVPLVSEGSGAATVGRYTFILTKDNLGASALMIINDEGLLVRTEPLGSTGRFDIVSSPLGVICSARDQGAILLYGADGKRRWIAHLPGPITAIASDESGITAAFGPPPGAKAGDGVVSIAGNGAVGRAVTFPYGAVTALARGSHRSVAVSVFTADPRKAAEALMFLLPDGTSLPVVGAGLGSARLAAGDETYFAGTVRAIAAYDSCGQRRWTARSADVLAIAARGGTVVAAHRDAITGHDAADGRELWRQRLGATPDAIASDADGIIVATQYGLAAFDWQGQPRWALADKGVAWDLGDGMLVVIQREMAIAYRTR